MSTSNGAGTSRKCGGNCGCGTAGDGVTRREFIGLAAAGAVMATGGPPDSVRASKVARLKREAMGPAAPRRYRPGKHGDARMHLGGIGTGNFEIGVDGRFTTWNLSNGSQDGELPFCFGLKVGETARLLQTIGGPESPHIADIEMIGEYPVACLRFKDPAVPAEVDLTAFSPFAPLDERISEMPVAMFVFRVKNPSDRPQTVSLAAFLQNAVGYEGDGAIDGVAHPQYGGNRNTVHREAGTTILTMDGRGGQIPTLDRPVQIATNLCAGLGETCIDRPTNLAVSDLNLPANGGGESNSSRVIWLEEIGPELPAASLRTIRAAVSQGATLLFSGRSMPLLGAFAAATDGGRDLSGPVRPDIVFEDFEHGYDRWTVEGTAFGSGPATAALGGQHTVLGFQGHAFATSFHGADGTTGRLTSRVFAVERCFIRFLIGGGDHPGTQVRLVVDGKVVRAASGRDDESLQPVTWDVRDLLGRSARIVVVDEETAGWGHVSVDQIEFLDFPGDLGLLAALHDLLPARFGAMRGSSELSGEAEVVDLTLLPGAQTGNIGARRSITRAFGRGSVVLALGSILAPEHAGMVNARQRAYPTLCGLVGATYTPPDGMLATAPGFGAIGLAALDGHATALPQFVDWKAAWRRFAASGEFESVSETPRTTAPSPPGRALNAALATRVTVAPGETREISFLLAWHFPNRLSEQRFEIGNHYAHVWPDLQSVMKEAITDFSRLRSRTERFRKTFYGATLPYWLLDCLTSQFSSIRHAGVLIRTANGDVYGWEGSNGCCPPTCTHVWGYEQSMARLFPALERDMRRIDFTHQQRADGGINNRTEVPSPPHPTGEQPFADGHASCILKAYREALNSPDDTFLKTYWPPVRSAVEYLIRRDSDGHGGQPNGTLEDTQWSTYDQAFHGVTPFISAYYLAALRAGEEWARRLGDSRSAARFRDVFENGRRILVEVCWDGEYFRQHLPGYQDMPLQIGPGCMSDQMIGQWWAHQLGLGYLLPENMVRSALHAIFEYNWQPDLTGSPSPRAFPGASGLLLCTWPKGGRPAQAMQGSDELWSGVEYQVAGHLIYEGLVEEGFAVIKGVRDRYDGVPRAPITRNPWNEIECGGHYARTMSSWSALLALSGFRYDGPAGVLEFAPRFTPDRFQSFFTAPECWGSLRQTRWKGEQQNHVTVAEGGIRIASLHLNAESAPRQAHVTLGGKNVPIALSTIERRSIVTFEEPAVVTHQQPLTVVLT